MSALEQFLASLLGGTIAIAFVLLFSKRSREHLLAYLAMVLAIAFTLPLYRLFLEGSSYGLFVLPLIGGVLAGGGFQVGLLIERWVKPGRQNG